MIETEQIQQSRSIRSTLLPYAGGTSLGLGLWLTFNNFHIMPAGLLVLALFLILAGSGYLILKAWKHRNSLKKILDHFILPLSFGLGLAVLLLLFEHFLAYLRFPYPLEDGEGFVLNQAVLLARHQQLYPPINEPPYIVTNYPPFYQLILSWFTDPLHPDLIKGRIISVFASILLMASVGGTVGSITRNKWAGIISSILVASSPVIYFWGALLRVDLLASALSMLGIWIVASRQGPNRYFAVIPLVAAIYTRQSSVEAIAAIVIGSFLITGPADDKMRSDRLFSVFFALSWLFVCATIFLILQSSTNGEFFRHIVTYTRTQFFPERVLSSLKWILPSHALIIVLAILAFPRALFNRHRLIPAIFFIGAICTALLSGKVGSDLNYFINLIAASAVLGGFFFHDISELTLRDSKPVAVMVLALLLVPGAIVQSGLFEGDRNFSFTPQQEDYRAGEIVAGELAQHNGMILSEDEGFTLLSGHEVVFNPFIMSELARENIWDENDFVDAIENKMYDTIMLRFYVNDPNNDDKPGEGSNAGWDRWTPAMEYAIQQNYRLDTNVSPIFMRRYWFIYRPIPDQVYDFSNNEDEGPHGTDLLGE